MVNTERMPSGSTITFTWTPSRPGNWLFHCHDNLHLAPGAPLDASPRPQSPNHQAANHALEMMGGPVIGVHVLPKEDRPPRPESPGPSRLRLTAREDVGGTR